MKTVTTKAVAKVAAVATGLAMATSMLSLAPMAHAAALTSAQVQSILSLLTSFGADSATIANVQASLTGGTPSTTTTTTTSSSCSFTKDLTIGSTGSEVTCLQNGLKAGGYMSANATGYFGSLTQAGVIAWQKAMGVSPTAGYFGARSRAAWGGTSSTGTGTVSAGTGTGLKISLAATSPNGTVLVQGQGIGDLADFVFANPTSAPINVTGLTFKRTGVSNDATLSNVYLYNGVNRLTDSAGVSSSQFSYANSAGIFTVPAGQTYTVSVRADIAGSTSGQQLGVSLVSATSNGTLDSSVSFPIMSGYQTISAATLAGVDFTGTTLPTTNANLNPTSDYVVWQSTVAVSTNPVKFTSIKLTNLGSIDSTYLQNVRLYVDGVQVGSSAAVGADRTVTFDLSSAPVSLTTANHIVKVLANVTGGSSRTFQFSLQYSSDVQFVDNQLNQPVTPTVSGASFTAVSSGLQTVLAVSGATGVSVSRAAASPSDDISVGVSNVKLASFNMLASGEDVKVKDLYVYAATTTPGNTTTYLTNGKIMVNGIQVGSTKTLGNTAGTATDFSLGSSLILPAAQTTVVDVYADAKTAGGYNVASGQVITASLKASTSNGQGQSSLNAVNVPNSTDVSGNPITVTASALTATSYSGYGNQTMVAGSNNVRLGSFTLSAGSTEGINVNTIALDLAGYAGVQNLMLKDSSTGTQLGSTISTPAATGNSFPVTFTIPASGTKTIDIYGNILSNASVSIVATLTTSTSGTGAVTGTSASLSGSKGLQTIVVGSGLLTMARSASNPVNANVLAGASQIPVATYTLTAQNSPFTVKKLQFEIPNGVATSTTGLTLQYKDVNGATQTASQSVAVSATASSTVTFTGLSFYVPMNDSADIQVFTGVPSISSGAVSGAAITIGLDHATGFQATDATGNATTSIGTADVMGASTGYGTFYVRKSIPTFTGQSYNSTSEPVGSDLYKFTVAADPAGAIEIDDLAFKVSTSTVTVTGYTLYDATSGTPTALNASAVTNANASGIVAIKPDSVIQIGAGQTKTFTLRASTFSGTWGAGAGIHVNLAPADAFVANAAASGLEAGNNYVWSDRSAPSHTTSTSDWTSGFLLKNLIDGTYNFAY